MNTKKFVILFLVKATLCYLLWYFIYEQWLAKVGWLDEIIINNLVVVTNNILIFMGYTTFLFEHTLGIDGSNGVYIGTPCNGLELMALFSGFVLIFNGSWKNKIWYIPFGVIIIHILNIFRVLSLAIIAKVAPETLDFNHKYTFTLMLYLIVFLGWVIWVKRFALKK
jgi:exosortase family protein XrtF